jgi:hypothetical protein
MNKKLIDQLVEKSKVLYNDETVGLEYLVFDRYLFVKNIIDELDNVFSDNFYVDPHEIYNFFYDVKEHFGIPSNVKKNDA